MKVVDEGVVTEAGRRLAAAAPDAQVILFGSHARGEASPHSDVDFLVVEPEVANEVEESVRGLAGRGRLRRRLSNAALAPEGRISGASH
jgi:predicted nucleotidyltransferase